MLVVVVVLFGAAAAAIVTAPDLVGRALPPRLAVVAAPPSLPVPGCADRVAVGRVVMCVRVLFRAPPIQLGRGKNRKKPKRRAKKNANADCQDH
jgi:hypothetical protein